MDVTVSAKLQLAELEPVAGDNDQITLLDINTAVSKAATQVVTSLEILLVEEDKAWKDEKIKVAWFVVAALPINRNSLPQTFQQYSTWRCVTNVMN